MPVIKRIKMCKRCKKNANSPFCAIVVSTCIPAGKSVDPSHAVII